MATARYCKPAEVEQKHVLHSTHPRHAEPAVDPPLPSWLDEEDVSLSILWLLENLHLLQDHLNEA